MYIIKKASDIKLNRWLYILNVHVVQALLKSSSLILRIVRKITLELREKWRLVDHETNPVPFADITHLAICVEEPFFPFWGRTAHYHFLRR